MLIREYFLLCPFVLESMLLEATETSMFVCIQNIRINAHNTHFHWKIQAYTQYFFVYYLHFLLVGKFPERYNLTFTLTI